MGIATTTRSTGREAGETDPDYVRTPARGSESRDVRLTLIPVAEPP
jgi:hypothetical protein